MLTRSDQEALHRYSSHNRHLLETVPCAGCFYCRAVFAPSEITDWVDGTPSGPEELDDGVTALCPRCGIDSVLPGEAGIAITPELLAQMNDYWF